VTNLSCGELAPSDIFLAPGSRHQPGNRQDATRFVTLYDVIDAEVPDWAKVSPWRSVGDVRRSLDNRGSNSAPGSALAMRPATGLKSGWPGRSCILSMLVLRQAIYDIVVVTLFAYVDMDSPSGVRWRIERPHSDADPVLFNRVPKE